MKTQLQLCYEASHYATMSIYADFIRGMETKRKIMLANGENIAQIDKDIDRQIEIFASM